jgi:hypothetical protein
MDDLVWNICVSIVITIWIIHVFKILPKVRKTRTIYLRDWGFGFGAYKVFFEYKALCQKDNESLIWYKTQIYLFWAFIFIGFILTWVLELTM